MSKSVTYYVKGIKKNEVNFPNGHIACRHCPYCRTKIIKGETRHCCIETLERLTDIVNQVGQDCVLELIQVK